MALTIVMTAGNGDCGAEAVRQLAAYPEVAKVILASRSKEKTETKESKDTSPRFRGEWLQSAPSGGHLPITTLPQVKMRRPGKLGK